MILGALGVNLLPSAYFGLAERLSTFAAVGFNAVLGIYTALIWAGALWCLAAALNFKNQKDK